MSWRCQEAAYAGCSQDPAGGRCGQLPTALQWEGERWAAAAAQAHFGSFSQLSEPSVLEHIFLHLFHWQPISSGWEESKY